MEEPPEIKGVSVHALSKDTMRQLSVMLNAERQTTNADHKVADYRGLAELYDRTFPDICKLEGHRDPTGALLASLSGTPESLLTTLWKHLLELGRTDVLSRCKDLFRRDAVNMRLRSDTEQSRRNQVNMVLPSRPMATNTELPLVPAGTGSSRSGSRKPVSEPCQDLHHSMDFSGLSRDVSTNHGDDSTLPISSSSAGQGDFRGCVATQPRLPIYDDDTMFDAFVNYSKKDTNIAIQLAVDLLAPPYDLKLFIHEIHLQPGGCEFEDMANIIRKRCIRSKVIIILTENYVDDEACHFITNYVRSLDSARMKKQLIPVLYTHLVHIPVLSGIHFLDKQRLERRGWYLPKLVKSIRS